MSQAKTHLLISKKSLKTKLSHLINEANSIKDFNQISENHLKAAKRTLQRWEKRTKIYLKHSFSNGSIAEKFPKSSGVFLMKSASFKSRCEELIDDVDEQITKLKIIIENEDIKEELSHSKLKIFTKNKIQWKHWVSIIVVLITAISIIIVAFINKSDTKQNSTQYQNEVKVILNNHPNSPSVGEVNEKK